LSDDSPLPVDKDFQQALSDVRTLYAKTKRYIIRAEEIDPTLRSNIAVFKEQRDALDHIVRAMNEYLEKGDSADKRYISNEFDDAIGHLYRAAYDALDGMGISYKIRMNRIMEDFSMQAICAVYPQYLEALDAVEVVQERIIEHREKKDQRRTTLSELDAYLESIETIDGHYKASFRKIHLIQKWDEDDKKKAKKLLILVPLGIAILAAIFLVAIETAKDWYLHRQDRPALSSPSPSASP
jgi:hypothetical protein